MAKPQENPTHKAVEEWLDKAGVKFLVAGGSATKLDGWECDKWLYTFRRGAKEVSDNYHTGTGHRVLTGWGKQLLKGPHSAVYRANVEREHSVAVKPHPASVLRSVLLDIGGAAQNFQDWASEFGFDTGSRKAFKTYEACCDMRVKVLGFFTHSELEELEKLLEDY